ncbi:S1C family serine protease [Lapillicoccus sp.]|uniref:S1C family serine protease n=1 Tax=Lapillicoccus sp. TaxID=1909287 RepID=UPI00398319BD
MSDSGREQGPVDPSLAVPPGGSGDPWNDVGVPDGGSSEAEPTRPAMFERPQHPVDPAAPVAPVAPGEIQPIDRTQPIEVPHPTLESEANSPWWSTPSSDPSADGGPPPEGQPAHPTGVPSGEPSPVTQSWYGAAPPPQGPMAPPPQGASALHPTRMRRGGRGAGVAGLALVSALVGGVAVVVAERSLDRSTSLGSALPAPGPGSTARADGSIAKIAANALPSVVTIKIKASAGSGTGSGFVIDKQGHILTNNHVVSAAGGAGTITVELNNGTTLPATVVGKDSSYDLAVLKVDTLELVPLEFGPSTDVVVGDGVIAVGAPLGLDATVTSGIVSALNRAVTPGDGNEQSFINAIQTDAAINPGNSGGPLLDMNGRVIGVNSAIARVPGSDSSTGGNIGVGFSIPSDQAAKTAQQLIRTGKAEHPVLGVKVDRSYDGDGAKVAKDGVDAGSAAERAGLKGSDVVTEFEGRKVVNADALIVSIRSKSVGDTIRLKILRDGAPVDVTMTLQAATG